MRKKKHSLLVPTENTAPTTFKQMNWQSQIYRHCTVSLNTLPLLPAPCPPTSVQAFRDCDVNQALIVWQNDQLTGLYTATIEDESRARLNCTSNTVNKCNITSPPCGKRFNVTVTYSDGHCLSTSTPISMDSGSKLKGIDSFCLEE